MIIPANRAGIFNFVCKIPEIKPAQIPPTNPKRVAINGERPCVIQIAAIPPPSGKLPSAVKSAISSILKVIKTPMANNDHNIP